MTIFIMDGHFPITTPKKTTIAAVEGEWWIENGTAEYADANVGDYGHEAIVIEHIRSLYGFEPFAESSTWEQYIMERGKNFIMPRLEQAPESREEIIREFSEDPMPFIKESFEEEGMTEEEWQVANDMIDGREYAMRELGWIRVSRRSIQVHTLNSETISKMVRGLEDIFDQTGTEEGNEGDFDIEVSASRKYLRDVPYDTIRSVRRSGDMQELLGYAGNDWTFAESESDISIMGNNEPIVTSQFTGQRNFDRMDTRDNDTIPLTKEEGERLGELKAKVNAAGTPSALTPEEYKEYDDLGLRHNLTLGKHDEVLLPTAIKPWITQ